MSDQFTTSFQALGNKTTVRTLGFINGFLWEVPNMTQLLEFPLSTSFNGAFSGGFYTICADIVHGYFPDNYKWIPSTVLAGSLAWNIAKRVKSLTQPP